MLSTINVETATLFKPNTRNMLTFWKVDWPQNKPLSNWNHHNHPLLELKINITCNRYGSKKKRAQSSIFCGCITIKMLCQLWRQCKMWLTFTTTKISICWSLVVHYQTWLTFVYTNIPIQNSIPSQSEKKTYWKKFENTSLFVHLSFLPAKQLLMELLFESAQTYANVLLVLISAEYNPTQCVNLCSPVFIRVGISIQKPVDWHLDKTRLATLKTWSCLIFNNEDLIVKLRVSTLQAIRRILTVSVLMCSVLIAILLLKQWVAFTIFVTVETCDHLSLKKKSNVPVRKKDRDELRRGQIQDKRFTVIEMWECEWWRLYKVITCLSTYPRKLSL